MVAQFPIGIFHPAGCVERGIVLRRYIKIPLNGSTACFHRLWFMTAANEGESEVLRGRYDSTQVAGVYTFRSIQLHVDLQVAAVCCNNTAGFRFIIERGGAQQG